MTQQRAAGLYAEAAHQARDEMLALQQAREHVGDGSDVEPGWLELAALDSAGPPWNQLATVARELVRLESDMYQFALEVIWPDESMRGRLFQLAVYGEVLAALRDGQYVLQSRLPLTGSSSAPNHVAASWRGDDIHVWFEASGSWDYYGSGPTAYKTATAGIGGQAVPSPDCLVARVGDGGHVKAALIIECKESLNATYVARDGYLQALAYGTEFTTRTQTPTRAYTVGLDALVRFRSETDVFSGGTGLALQVGVAPAGGVASLVSDLIR
ncbi:MAG: hypothetical protein ACJ735_05830 [Actinomycetes bacterium]